MHMYIDANEAISMSTAVCLLERLAVASANVP